MFCLIFQLLGTTRENSLKKLLVIVCGVCAIPFFKKKNNVLFNFPVVRYNQRERERVVVKRNFHITYFEVYWPNTDGTSLQYTLYSQAKGKPQ